MAVLGVVCFNPCFNGTYSLTIKDIEEHDKGDYVLILVLMELTL